MRWSAAILVALLLVGCDQRGSVITLKQPRPPASAAAVQIFTAMPPRAEQLGIIEAQTTGGWSRQGWMDSAVGNLKELAAEMGANGVVMEQAGTSPQGYAILGGGAQPMIAAPIGGYPVLRGTAIYAPR